MPTSEELTDSYLAALLAREADDPTKSHRPGTNRPKDAPKPNLRFLRNIIRETDSHNAVLIERDRQLISRGLKSHGSSFRTSSHDEDSRPNKRQRSERPDKWSSALARQGLHRKDEDKAGVRARIDDERHHQSSRSHQRQRDQNYGRLSRSRSPQEQRSSKHRHRSRDRHARRPRSSSPRPWSKERMRSAQSVRQDAQESDSDPLEALVGPRPPPKVKPRGRGTTAGSSGIDARFEDANYDPAKDIQHDPDDDNDWNMALSALQDRAKWRAIGADRLRAAGFGDADIAKWEKDSGLASGTRSEDVENVVWKKRGEARDWDRGKVTQADGETTTKVPWLEDLG